MSHRRSLVAAAAALLVAGCAGGAGPPPNSMESSAANSCPAASPRAALAWPDGVPADLPMPPGTVIGRTQRQPAGVTVEFTAPLSLGDAVRFVTPALSAAGYNLGRGEMERREAEVAFTKGRARGQYKIITTGECSTRWLLSVLAPPG